MTKHIPEVFSPDELPEVSRHEADRRFEDDVRRIARLLWPEVEHCGAAIEDSRERDGVFECEEFVYVIECTTSRAKAKAVNDSDKLKRLIHRISERNPEKHVKGWFITKQEPTADQRTAVTVASKRISVCSFDQFRSKLVDARSYLDFRQDYPFGSVRDPSSGKPNNSIDYVELDIVDSRKKLHSVNDIYKSLQSGSKYVLIGDYGSGKSTTLREIFLKLAHSFRNDRTLLFPLLLNLRDHHGQRDPVEAIERHARSLGFSKPSNLVRAWRAGLTVVLLDGFDEVAMAGWAGGVKKLSALRYGSMELVRRFVHETPSSTGVLLAGREHFFDSERELRSALAADLSFNRLDVSEFTDEQIKKYLGKHGWVESIPEWVPSRPLLLGYLASKGLLRETILQSGDAGPATGWDTLLDRVSSREAEIEAGIDSGTVRRLIAHLATLARSSPDGVGPIQPDQITRAFVEVCGYQPDDRGLVLLQRLPGLGGHSSEDGARNFIDSDFAEAARGSAIAEFIEDPFGSKMDSTSWQTILTPLGAQVAAHRCASHGFSANKVTTAFARANDERQYTLCGDLVLTTMYMKLGLPEKDYFIKEVIIPSFDFEFLFATMRGITFQDCIIVRMSLFSDAQVQLLPMFTQCHFDTIEGRSGESDMPNGRFLECEFGSFDNSAQTTDAILGLNIPNVRKVILTILRKLYVQKGSGRRESALYRGLDVRIRDLVPSALALLSHEGFASKFRQGDQLIWYPSRLSTYRKRALNILAKPNSVEDSLMKKAM